MTFVPSLLNVAECQYAKFLVDDLVNPHRVHGIADVEQDTVARARARRERELRERGDVMALIGPVRLLRARSVIAAFP